MGEIDGSGSGCGEAGELEELVAGESRGGGIFGVGEGEEALDAHGVVGLGEEAGLLGEESGAECAVGCVLVEDEELVAFVFGEISERESAGVSGGRGGWLS